MYMPLQLGSKPFTGSALHTFPLISMHNLFIVPPFWFLQYTLQECLEIAYCTRNWIKILMKVLFRLKSLTEILPELLWNWNHKLLFHRKQTVYLEQEIMWHVAEHQGETSDPWAPSLFHEGEKTHYWVITTPALAMLAFQMQPMALGSISDSPSCKCQGPLQRLKELLSALKIAFTPAIVMVHEEAEHTNSSSSLCSVFKACW